MQADEDLFATDFEIYLTLPPATIEGLINRDAPDFRFNPQLHFCANFVRHEREISPRELVRLCRRALVRPEFQRTVDRFLRLRRADE